jgi:NAD(P)-dependent dehydrogenase (short-subunit alcohol dehydrogenase family)
MISGDIANLEDLDHIYKVIAGTKKKLDIVVANAGFVEVVATVDVSITVKRLARDGKIPAHPVTNGVRKRWRFLIDVSHVPWASGQ